MKLRVSLHLALAVAGLTWLSGPVAAQPATPTEPIPTFEIYGTLVPFTEVARSTGATEPGSADAMNGATQVAAAAYTGLNVQGRGIMDPSTSNIGFRGGVELMHDLSVLWQIEQAVGIDAPNAGATIAGRNSYLGLTGSWGTAFVGNWDTPYKWGTNPIVNPVRAGILPDYNSILHNPGFNVSSVAAAVGRAGNATDAAFYRRAGNGLQYWTPTFNGLSARFLYQLTEGRTIRGVGGAGAATVSIKPSIIGATVAYDQGPLKLRGSIEAHLDYFGMFPQGGSAPGPNNRSSLDTGIEVLAQYTNVMPDFDTRVVGVGELLTYTNDDTTMGAVKSHSRPAFYGLVDQTLMGKHHLYAAVGVALQGSCELVDGGDCSTAGLGAFSTTLGYVYRFSKNTDIWVSAYRITNDRSAAYTTSPALGAYVPGADIEAIGIGFLHSFSVKIGGPAAKPAAPKPPEPPPPPAPVEPAAPAGTPPGTPPPNPSPNPNPNP